MQTKIYARNIETISMDDENCNTTVAMENGEIFTITNTSVEGPFPIEQEEEYSMEYLRRHFIHILSGISHEHLIEIANMTRDELELKIEQFNP